MLDTKLLKNNINSIIDSLNSRNFDKTVLSKISILVKTRNENIQKLSLLQAEKNIISKKIPLEKDKSTLLKQANEIKEKIFMMEEKILLLKNELDILLPTIPNTPLENVPIGKDETDNVVISEFPEIGRGLVKVMKPHYEIGVDKNIIDFERAVKMSGTRFVIYKNEGSKLVRALTNFMLDTHTKNGYTEMSVPLLVNSNTMYGTGQLPKFEDDLFKVAKTDL